MDRTPETCPYIPDLVIVEFSAYPGNPLAKFVRFIVTEQVWSTHHGTGLVQVHRSVKDIAEVDQLRQTNTPRRLKEFLRHYIKTSPGEVLESVSFRGDISDRGLGDEEPQATFSNVRLTDHTLAIAEFTMRHMVMEFMNREVADDS